MTTNLETQSHGTDGAVSAQDILAVASGVAGNATANRVWAESATDRALRNRVAWSLPPEDEEEQIADALADASDAVSERLQNRVRSLTERFVQVKPIAVARRVLSVLETLLRLPCLAPAVAASDPAAADLRLATQTVSTKEGVQVLFQQLPPTSGNGGDADPILRVLVDASALEGGADYGVATVTIAGSGGGGGDTPFPVTVPLNAQGRGLIDVGNLPPATSGRYLVAVSLSPE